MSKAFGVFDSQSKVNILAKNRSHRLIFNSGFMTCILSSYFDLSEPQLSSFVK